MEGSTARHETGRKTVVGCNRGRPGSQYVAASQRGSYFPASDVRPDSFCYTHTRRKISVFCGKHRRQTEKRHACADGRGAFMDRNAASCFAGGWCGSWGCVVGCRLFSVLCSVPNTIVNAETRCGVVCPGCGLQQDRPFLLHEGPGCLLPCQRPGLVR